jgi:CcmD family protein
MTMNPLKWCTYVFATIVVAGLLALPTAVSAGDGAAQGAGDNAQVAAGEEAEADDQAPADAADEEASEQRPTLGQSSVASQERTLPGGVLASATYILLWVCIFGFVFAILRRQRRLDAEIEALERRMDQVFETLE